MLSDSGSMRGEGAGAAAADGLVESLVAALTKLGGIWRGNSTHMDSGDDPSAVALALQIVHSVALLGDLQINSVVKRLPKGLDIFSPVIACDNSTDALGVLVACCSVHRPLHTLITQSMDTWAPPLTRIEPGNGTPGATPGATPPQDIGFYSVVSLVSYLDTTPLTPHALSYLKLDLGPTLRHRWLPLWLSRSTPSLHDHIRTGDTPTVMTSESLLDYYIATGFDKLDPQLPYFSGIIAQRLVACGNWVSTEVYESAVQWTLGKLENTTRFHLQVLMEVVDHPRVQFRDEARLVALLGIALRALRNTPVNDVQAELYDMGSTLTYAALLAVVQLIVASYILGVAGSGSDLPPWFNDIVPRVPPISKSLFRFDTQRKTFVSTEQLTTQLCNVVAEAAWIGNKVLLNYTKNEMNPLKLDMGLSDTASAIPHMVATNYMQLYYIPMFTVSMLAYSIAASEHGSAAKWAFLGTQAKRAQLSRILLTQTHHIAQNLASLHGNVAVYHLVKFASRVARESLPMQRIGVAMLNHILFHNFNDSHEIISHCLHNKLAHEALRDYVHLWNDGSATYTQFYTRIFQERQPPVETCQTTVLELCKRLPQEQYSDIVTAMQPVEPLQPQPQRSMKTYISPSNKFNAYSSSSFVPASASTSASATTTPAQNNYLFATPVSTPNGNIQVQHQMPQQSQSSSSAALYNTTATAFADDDSMNNDVLMNHQQDTFSAFSSPFTLPSHKTAEMINSTPKTPGSNNPWNEVPQQSLNMNMNMGIPMNMNINANANVSKIVSTGKNYILGGHNRVKNNSRAQSIHIDQFQDNTPL